MNLNVDKLNFFLLIISFVLACFLPFEIFLFGYAFLGPLHYLTEVNWIRDKNYFVVNFRWKYLVLIVAVIYSLPFIASLPLFSEYLKNNTFSFFRFGLPLFTNILLFVVLISSVLSIYYKNYKALILGFILATSFSLLIYKDSAYILTLGLFIPTIIHVYFFTILFMIYGTKKSKSKFGLINIVTIITLPVLLIFINTDIFNYDFTPLVKETFVKNNFHILNANILKLLGVYEDLRFFFSEKVDVKVQIFIAFAYIYHYLNWFSKTTIIGWHKQLTHKKTLIILMIWLFIASLYVYNYRLGLVMSIFLSIVHVMLEFPLNFITIKSLFSNK